MVAVTDERELIVSYIVAKMGKVDSLLDIGIGDGVITSNLIEFFKPKKAVVVEPDIVNATNFKKNKPLSIVINKKWENSKVKGKFDLIVCSHTAYFLDENKFEEELIRAMSLLTKNGTFFLIVNTDDAPLQKLYKFLKVNRIETYSKVLEFSNFKKGLPTDFKIKKHTTVIPGITSRTFEDLSIFMWDFLSTNHDKFPSKKVEANFKKVLRANSSKNGKLFLLPTSIYQIQRTTIDKVAW